MTIGILTPLQLDAGYGLLQNQGITVSPKMEAAITAYKNTPLISALFASGQQGAGIAANSCPALSDSVPVAYAALGNQMDAIINAEANVDICGGNVSKFVQAINQTLAYGVLNNQFLYSAKNSQTYLGNTFTTMNSMITGGVTTINLATTAFGQDLTNLGQLINLNDLDNLGSPLALIQQIYSVTGTIPAVSIYFIAVGIPSTIVLNLTDPAVTVTDSIQALMYQAMTQITGDNLNQILTVLRVNTVGITTMADLLNPAKLFPNSFQSLTVPTKFGPRAIYINSSASVNTTLKTELPPYVMSSLI